MTRYIVDYRNHRYETTRCKPGVLTHALVLDDGADEPGTARIEWCGSYAIAAREQARVRARIMASWLEYNPRYGQKTWITICDVLETS